MQSSRKLKLIAPVLAMLCSANSHAINGVYDYGMGQINRGMGGAGVAMPKDAFATVINPAGLGVLDHKADAGIALYFPDMYSRFGQSAAGVGILDAPAGTYNTKQRVFFLPDAAYVYHHDWRNHFGVSVNSIGGFGSRYTTSKHATVLGVQVPRRGVLGDGTIVSSLKIGSLNGTYNYFLMPNFGVGLTLSYYMQAFESRGSQGLQTFTKTFLSGGGVPTKLSNNGTDYNHGVGATAGVWYRYNKQLALAATATPKISMTKFEDYKDLLVNGGELDIPARYAAGINITPNNQLDLVVDVVQIMNKDVDAYGNNSRALFDGRCLPGPGAVPGSCVGGKNGPGFGWSNQTLLKVGGAYKLSSRDTVRLGFSYGNRIGHPDDVVINTFAPGSAARLITSAGYSRTMPCYTLNTFLTFIPSQTMSGINELSVAQAQTVKVKVAGVGFGFGVSV
jgi:long-chain fatty acid transport protein